MKQILIILFFIPAIAYSQNLLSETSFDLGEINQLNEDVVDLNIVNQSDQAIFILRMESASGVEIKYTSKNLKSKEAVLIRVKLNPKKTGKIKEEVKLYFSSNQTPIAVELTADVKIIPKDNRQACPSFTAGQLPQANFQQFSNQQQKGEINSFFLELIPEKEFKDWALAIEEQDPIEETAELIVEEISIEPTIPNLVTEKPKELEESNPLEIDEVKIVPIASPENLSGFDNSFKPNNIVFLIDASTSMREEERMDLLKMSMINLLDNLREIDYLSIVTYSGEAKVLLPPTSGISKEAIRKSIENIVADGSTQAVKGIKKAIQTGSSNFIEGGNNQIILATDGAFNIGEKNLSLRRKIESTAKDGLTITVLGIKNDKWTNKSLKEISDLGKGELIKINGERDANKVLEEIKKKSKI